MEFCLDPCFFSWLKSLDKRLLMVLYDWCACVVWTPIRGCSAGRRGRRGEVGLETQGLRLRIP